MFVYMSADQLLNVIIVNEITDAMLITEDNGGQFKVVYKQRIDKSNFCQSVEDILTRCGDVSLYMNNLFLASNCTEYHLGKLLLQEQLVVKEKALWERLVSYCESHSGKPYYATDLSFTNNSIEVDDFMGGTFPLTEIVIPVIYDGRRCTLHYHKGNPVINKSEDYLSYALLWNMYFGNRYSESKALAGRYITDTKEFKLMLEGTTYCLYYENEKTPAVKIDNAGVSVYDKKGSKIADDVFVDCCNDEYKEKMLRVEPTLCVFYHFLDGVCSAVVNGEVMSVECLANTYPESDVYLRCVADLVD